MNHGTDEQFENYVLGTLPPSDIGKLEEHLLLCTGCREKLGGMEDFALGMREALSSQPITPPQSIPWFRRPYVAIGFSFAVLILLLGVFSSRRTHFAPSASLQLTATRGEMAVTVPAREYVLSLADIPEEGGPFRPEVVNAMGIAVWTGLAASGAASSRIHLPRQLTPGDYFLRIYSASGRAVREYGFRVR